MEAEEAKVPIGAETVEEGPEVREHLIVLYAAKMRVISQRIANTTKLLEN